MKSKKKSSANDIEHAESVLLDEKIFKLDRMHGSEMANDTNELVILSGSKKKAGGEKSDSKQESAAPKKKLSKKERKKLEKVLERKEKTQRVSYKMFFFSYF